MAYNCQNFFTTDDNVVENYKSLHMWLGMVRLRVSLKWLCAKYLLLFVTNATICSGVWTSTIDSTKYASVVTSLRYFQYAEILTITITKGFIWLSFSPNELTITFKFRLRYFRQQINNIYTLFCQWKYPKRFISMNILSLTDSDSYNFMRTSFIL